MHDYLCISKENKSINGSLIQWWYQYYYKSTTVLFQYISERPVSEHQVCTLNTSTKRKWGFCQNVSWVSRGRRKVSFKSLTSFKVPSCMDSPVCLQLHLVCRNLASSWARGAGFAFMLQPKLSLVCQIFNYSALFLKSSLVGLCTTKGKGQHFLKWQQSFIRIIFSTCTTSD